MGKDLIDPGVSPTQIWFSPRPSELQALLVSLRSTLKEIPLTEKQASEVDFYLQKIFQQVAAAYASEPGRDPHPPELERLSFTRQPPVSQTNHLTFCSAAMHKLVQTAERTAGRDVPVLISGETGVGKELIARYIHLNSARRHAPLIPFNCAAVPRELFESQLFGHRQGAFTGATRGQVGVIRAAAGGTLLLDEIGELPLELQPKLLRFLQEGEVQPVGDDRPVQVQVRVIALTNRDLEAEVIAHRFRADLYYRLNIVSLGVPPLRHRREDIPVLVNFFLEKFSGMQREPPRRMTPEAMACLVAYNWPGNIRELSNLLLKLVTVTERDAVITLDDLPFEIRQPSLLPIASHGRELSGQNDARHSPVNLSLDLMLGEAIDLVERYYVRNALLRHHGQFSKAARQLGLSTFGLRKKYRRLFPAEDDPGNLAKDSATE